MTLCAAHTVSSTLINSGAPAYLTFLGCALRTGDRFSPGVEGGPTKGAIAAAGIRRAHRNSARRVRRPLATESDPGQRWSSRLSTTYSETGYAMHTPFNKGKGHLKIRASVDSSPIPWLEIPRIPFLVFALSGNRFVVNALWYEPRGYPKAFAAFLSEKAADGIAENDAGRSAIRECSLASGTGLTSSRCGPFRGGF